MKQCNENGESGKGRADHTDAAALRAAVAHPGQEALNRAASIVAKLADQLQAKKYTTSKAEWMLTDEFSLYVRAQKRLINREIREVITIASIDVTPAYQRQGLFKQLVARLTEIARDKHMHALVVESVLNPDLSAYLVREGYAPIHQGELAPSFYRLV